MCAVDLRGPLRPKNNLANIVSLSQTLRGRRRAKYTSDKNTNRTLPVPPFISLLLPHTDHRGWPHQILEVIGYPLKHLNTTWRSNTHTHTNTHAHAHTQSSPRLYHPPTCACSYLNHAGWGPWVQGEKSEEGKRIWEEEYVGGGRPLS